MVDFAKNSLYKSASSTDVILPMQDPYMAQIIDGKKNYEFRKYCLKPSVKRIWFYRTAPHSSITHICETQPARTRKSGDTPLEEDGLGNAEYNRRDKYWDGYDFAYHMLTVYELWKPISLKKMKGKYGFKSAPRGLVYLPKSIRDDIDWKEQKLVRYWSWPGTWSSADMGAVTKSEKITFRGLMESCDWRVSIYS